MNASRDSQGLRALSFGSIALGLLGAIFYWWVPLGMVLGLSGFILGFIDSISARRRSLDYRMSIVGLLICTAALALDIGIGVLGLQTVTFGESP
jgi:hypothetical protein